MESSSKMNKVTTIGKVARTPKCARCRNHGFSVHLKGHAGKCPFIPCRCWKCSLITERTKIMATQRRMKKNQKDDSLLEDNASSAVGSTVDNVSTGAATPEQTMDNPCALPRHATDLVMSDTNVPTECVKTTVLRTETDGKIYAELQVPQQGPLAPMDPHQQNAAVAFGMREDVRHSYRNGGVDSRNPMRFPGDYLTTSVPFPVYPGYPSCYSYPAIIVNPVSVPFPPGAILCPPESGVPQEGFAPFVAPYPMGHQLPHLHPEREYEPRMLLLQPRSDAGTADGLVQGSQRSDVLSMDNNYASQDSAQEKLGQRTLTE